MFSAHKYEAIVAWRYVVRYCRPFLNPTFCLRSLPPSSILPSYPKSILALNTLSLFTAGFTVTVNNQCFKIHDIRHDTSLLIESSHKSRPFVESMGQAPTAFADTVHFVGSICLPDQQSSMETLFQALPGRLSRISDGEYGKRSNFVVFQRAIFECAPFVLAPFAPGAPAERLRMTPGTVPPPPPIEVLPAQYDEFAIAGYAETCRRRVRRVIPADGVRFQVSLPTPINVLGSLIEPSWRSKVEPIYEAAFMDAL